MLLWVQGAEQEDGSLLLIDPRGACHGRNVQIHQSTACVLLPRCILRPGKVTVSALLKGSAKDDREREARSGSLERNTWPGQEKQHIPVPVGD